MSDSLQEAKNLQFNWAIRQAVFRKLVKDGIDPEEALQRAMIAMIEAEGLDPKDYTLVNKCVGCTRPFISPRLLKSIDMVLPEYPERSSKDMTRCTTCEAVGDLIP